MALQHPSQRLLRPQSHVTAVAAIVRFVYSAGHSTLLDLLLDQLVQRRGGRSDSQVVDPGRGQAGQVVASDLVHQLLELDVALAPAAGVALPRGGVAVVVHHARAVELVLELRGTIR